MDNSGNQNEFDQLANEAALWHIRLTSGETTAEIRKSFDLWWMEDPRHREAYEEIRETMQLVDESADSPAIKDLRLDTTSRLFTGTLNNPVAKKSFFPRFAITAVAVIVLSIALLFVIRVPSTQLIETEVGERHSVTLEDGSRISLDESTRILIQYSDKIRTLELESGQARFEVAHNDHRPFTVLAHDTVVLATGTNFNVELLNSGLVITLIEGSVSIGEIITEDISQNEFYAREQPIKLLPAEQLLVTKNGGTEVHSQVNLEGVTAWEEGKLVFDDQSLLLAVERMNRYSKYKIILADEIVEQMQISGVFNAGDTRAFADGLTSFLPVTVIKQVDGQIILARK